MKLLLIAFLVLWSLTGNAQKPRTIYTDSSRIESRIYPSGKEVKEFVTSKDRVHYWFYRDNQAKATTISIYTKDGRAIGLTKEYDNKGKLLYTVDHERGTWTIANAKIDFYYQLRQQIKAKADRLIAALYGQYFLTNNVAWNVEMSAIYSLSGGKNWTDFTTEPPFKFLLRYDVKLDPNHVYPELIEFALDAQGNYMPDDYEDVYGFEKVLSYPLKGFDLVYDKAVEIARKKSGIKNIQLRGVLKWEKEINPFMYNPSLYTGRFLFYIPVKTSFRNDIHLKGRSRITTYYDVYKFSPWTGDFLGIQRMESVKEWEENSGFTSGLVPRS